MTLWRAVYSLFLPEPVLSQYDLSTPQNRSRVQARQRDLVILFTRRTAALFFSSTSYLLRKLLSILCSLCSLRAPPYCSGLSAHFQCHQSNSCSLLFSHFTPTTKLSSQTLKASVAQPFSCLSSSHPLLFIYLIRKRYNLYTSQVDSLCLHARILATCALSLLPCTWEGIWSQLNNTGRIVYHTHEASTRL